MTLKKHFAMITRMIFIIIVFLTTCRQEICAQINSEVPDTTIYEMYEVDKTPILITDEKDYEISNLRECFVKNFQSRIEEDCSGRIVISFIIEKDGKLTNKKIVKKACAGLDENAMKVIDLMKTWKPAMKSERPVRMRFIFPMNIMIK